jgi:hypothetical protein
MQDIKVASVPWYRRKAWMLRFFGVPGFLVGAPVAYVLGIITMLPTGWELGENATTMITAGVTWLVAVGGAIAVWRYQQDQEGKAVGIYYLHVLETPLQDFLSLDPELTQLEADNSEVNWKALNTKIKNLSRAMSRVSVAGLEQNYQMLLKLDVMAVEMIVEELHLAQLNVNSALNELEKKARQASVLKPQRIDSQDWPAKLRTAVTAYQQFYEKLKQAV